MTAPRQRRSLSQPATDVQPFGPEGERLADAIDFPPDEAGGQDLTHVFHTYPGRIHPALVRRLLANLELPKGALVFNPFMGSGTVLVEAFVRGLAAAGSDLNPIAFLVARERLRRRTPADADQLFDRLEDLAERVKAEERRKQRARSTRSGIAAIRRYYPPHLFAEMVQWIDRIDDLDEGAERETLRAVFSSLVVKFSFRESDATVGEKKSAHPRGAVTRWMIAKTKLLLERQAELATRVPRRTVEPRLELADFRESKVIAPHEAYAIITSPPHPGTYDYHDQHRLRFIWLGIDGAPFSEAEIGARRRQERVDFRHDMDAVLRLLRRSLAPDGGAFVMIGDWFAGGRSIDGAGFLRERAPAIGLRVRSGASVRRLPLYGGRVDPRRVKREHLLWLEAAPDTKKVQR
jgi:hypothetical protein